MYFGGKALKKKTRARPSVGAAELTPRLVRVQNATDTVVRTTLRNDLAPGGIIHHRQVLSPVRCAFPNDLLASSGYTPEWG